MHVSEKYPVYTFTCPVHCPNLSKSIELNTRWMYNREYSIIESSDPSVVCVGPQHTASTHILER